MEKFSKVQNGDAKVGYYNNEKYSNKNLKIISFNDNEIVETKDTVVILPYLIEDGSILLQYNTVPNYYYKLKDSNEYRNVRDFLTVIKGPVTKDSPTKSVQEILSNYGFVLSSMFPIEIEKCLFKSENETGQYYTCILEIGVNDYRETFSKNSEARFVKISLGDIDDIKSTDVITVS